MSSDPIALLRGDSLQWLQQAPDKSVDLILTDFPYDMKMPRRLEFHREMLRVSRGATIVFCPPEAQWVNMAPEVSSPDQILFWCKPISTKNTSKSYSRFVEMILVYGRGAWETQYHWSNYVNVFQDLLQGTSDHPFEKPISLLERLIRNHSKEGELVLDPFMGSGTTGEACLRSRRRFTGVELDDTTFEMAAKRISAARSRPFVP